MSFGFSVGDFIAVGGVIADICNCLRDAGGSKRECQELERELQCLQKALVHLDSLNASNPSATLDSIRYAAISCRRPLEEFLSKIRKYDETLGPSTTTSSIQGGFSKIRFRFGPSKDAIKLQNYLVVHIGTINILLAQYGLETLTISCQRTEGHQDEIQRRLDSTQAWLARIQGGMSTQVSVIFRNLSLLERLYSMVNGEIKSTINSLKDAVMRAWYEDVLLGHTVNTDGLIACPRNKYLPWWWKFERPSTQGSILDGLSFKILLFVRMPWVENFQYHQSTIMIFWTPLSGISFRPSQDFPRCSSATMRYWMVSIEHWLCLQSSLFDRAAL